MTLPIRACPTKQIKGSRIRQWRTVYPFPNIAFYRWNIYSAALHWRKVQIRTWKWLLNRKLLVNQWKTDWIWKAFSILSVPSRQKNLEDQANCWLGYPRDWWYRQEPWELVGDKREREEDLTTFDYLKNKEKIEAIQLSLALPSITIHTFHEQRNSAAKHRLLTMFILDERRSLRRTNCSSSLRVGYRLPVLVLTTQKVCTGSNCSLSETGISSRW